MSLEDAIKEVAKAIQSHADAIREDIAQRNADNAALRQLMRVEYEEGYSEEDEEPAPVEVETKEQPNEGELLDIVTDGLDKIKEQYKSPKVFAKKLKAIGVDATGKTHEELFAQAKAKFDEISQ